MEETVFKMCVKTLQGRQCRNSPGPGRALGDPVGDPKGTPRGPQGEGPRGQTRGEGEAHDLGNSWTRVPKLGRLQTGGSPSLWGTQLAGCIQAHGFNSMW